MKFLVLHHTLNSAGGGERVSLAIIEALKELGGRVDLATVEKTDWRRVRRAFGDVSLPDKEMSILPLRLRLFGIYQRSLTGFYAYKYRKDYDLIINSHGDVMPALCDVTYMHFPTFTLLKQKPEVFVKYRKNLFWRIYFTPYEFIQAKLVRRYIENSLILTNSLFSKSVIKRWTGREAKVVYPPVEVKKFLFAGGKRENIVVTCSRFTPEKNLELIPEVASKVPKAKFYVFGSTSKTSWEVLYKVRKKAKELKAVNVRLKPNAPLSEMLSIYRKAKAYLHAMVGEHFGLSVVEAMASGLVPIVHKSGGPYLDILNEKQGVYGFYYEDADEAASHVNSLIENEEEASEIRGRAIERSLRFNKKSFKSSFVEAIKELIGLRAGASTPFQAYKAMKPH